MSDAQAHVLTGLTLLALVLLVMAFARWPVPMFTGLMFLAIAIGVGHLWFWFFEAYKGRS